MKCEYSEPLAWEREEVKVDTPSLQLGKKQKVNTPSLQPEERKEQLILQASSLGDTRRGEESQCSDPPAWERERKIDTLSLLLGRKLKVNTPSLQPDKRKES